MRYLLILVLFTNLAIAGQLEDLCTERNGTLFNSYKCPKSKLKLPVRTCEYTSEFGDLQFVNGCSGPSGGFKEVFFNACIRHDLCYHHEPSTNGLKRKSCDQLFLKLALEGCDELKQKQKKCIRWAKTMYNSLRVIGGPAYHCADEAATY